MPAHVPYNHLTTQKNSRSVKGAPGAFCAPTAVMMAELIVSDPTKLPDESTSVVPFNLPDNLTSDSVAFFSWNWAA